MSQFRLITTAALCSVLLSGCSWFGGDDDDADVDEDVAEVEVAEVDFNSLLIGGSIGKCSR